MNSAGPTQYAPAGIPGRALKGSGLPIYEAMLDITVHFEKLIAGVSRYHQYTLGTEPRADVRTFLQPSPKLFQ